MVDSLASFKEVVQVKRSVRREDSQLLARSRSYVPEGLQDSEAADSPGEGDPEACYEEILAAARGSVGHGATEGAFPEEWDAQLLANCDRTAGGARLVLFCPSFLAPSLESPDELDRAFQFILLRMDSVAMREKYVFVYCHLGCDSYSLWERLNLAHRILPRQYAENLERLIVLHPTSALRIGMWTSWSWSCASIWDRIEYAGDVDAVCEQLHPNDEAARADLRRRFPQMVQRRDAEVAGREAPVVFGRALGDICGTIGVDFLDRTTGRWYPRLPPALIFLCEAMEREGADEYFAGLFDVDARTVYDIVKRVDRGHPLDHNLPMAALWCVLKLFLDSTPLPLLQSPSWSMMDELVKRNVQKADTKAQHELLAEAFHIRLPRENAYVALYTASCLHTLCKNAQAKREASASFPPAAVGEPLTPALAAKVLGSGFLRPTSASHRRWLPAARAVVETLVRDLEVSDFWIGGPRPRCAW